MMRTKHEQADQLIQVNYSMFYASNTCSLCLYFNANTT